MAMIHRAKIVGIETWFVWYLDNAFLDVTEGLLAILL